MILFIDDEPFRVENDVEELTLCGYQVHLVTSVDDAVKFLETRHSDIDGVICDVMMPHGKAFSAEETRDGLRTGVRLFEWVHEHWPDMPFVVLTNVGRDEALREQLQRTPKCAFIEKKDYYGSLFTERVSELIPKRSEGAP